MGLHVTPEKAIRFTKITVALAFTWPPSINSSNNRLLLFNVLWWAAFVSCLGLLLPLLSAIYVYSNEPVLLGKTVSLFSAVAQVMIKMIVCRLMQKRCYYHVVRLESDVRSFQRLFFDMENFCKYATEEDRIVVQRHMDSYKYSHVVYAIWCFLTCLFVVSGPLYSPQMFPTLAIYPFPVEYQPMKSIIFFHQILVGCQATAGMAIDAQIALLLRYATVRFEILAIQLRKAKSGQDLNACIREHVKLLWYTKSVYKSVRFIALATVATTHIAVIFGSLNLVTKQPLLFKLLFALVVFSASVELIMYAWPADSLIHASNKTAAAAYETNWFEENVDIQRKIRFIILRSHRLEAIEISGIMPKITLSYYASFLYTAMTCFTALRIIVEKSNHD
ncbi:PREDICTED: odorant receptor 30a-like [Dufourea novaeangliae]|uniref:odorant receptor 30a-like n=1 Tax=Dufourea novaeangliae TaxID=178035 RepID=UPI00076746C3|nr:PREDICTED: odorant receptor 30a-like [Dufourea novaeangliae]